MRKKEATLRAPRPEPASHLSVSERTENAKKLLPQLIPLAKKYDAAHPAYPPALEAIRDTVKYAAKGNREAQNRAGDFYYSGNYGIPQNFELAFYWFYEAAMRGHSGARLQVAKMLQEGQGIQPDKAAAAQWYELLVDEGNLEALNNLAMMYKNGDGVPQDDEKAYYYMFTAATYGDPLAHFNLGKWFEQGRGQTKVDLNEAESWYRRAAEKGHLDALNNWGVIKARGAELTGILGSDPKPEVDYALKIFTNAVKQGNGLAAYNLAQFYRFGCGVEQNDQRALNLLSLAADRGVEKAAEMRREMNSEGKRKADDADISRSPSPAAKRAAAGSVGPT